MQRDIQQHQMLIEPNIIINFEFESKRNQF